MTTLTLTIKEDGNQVATFTAEVNDYVKLKEIKAAIQDTFADEEPQPQS